MFYFLHSEQASENASHFRGLLFEDLLKLYLAETGYSTRLTRTKRNSLEYDIVGEHRVHGQRVIGEAKAHEASISGQTVSAFVGKLLPHQLQENTIIGLFLSTSALTPDADDYLRSLAGSPYSLTAKCGAELEAHVRAELRLPSSDETRRAVAPCIPRVLHEHLLHTDAGTYVLAVGVDSDGGFSDRFAAVGPDGALVRDLEFLERVRSSLKPFHSTAAVTAGAPSAPAATRTIPAGLITATEWIDYRRPAGQGVFVGRVAELERAHRDITTANRGLVLEVKARSGVGKSSLLAVLASSCGARATVELHDARDVHAPADVLGVVKRFTGYPGQLTALEMVPAALDHLAESGGLPAALLIDQFESTFAAPDVFHAYEYVALAIARRADAFSFVYARKDDLLTTHDDMMVDLDRLRGLARPVSLDDLERSEANELISATSAAHRKHISAAVHAQVLEFAHGFPWLLKRTMAHILRKLESGVRQPVLASEGLQLADLFAEELGELDEVERGYLNRLARVLPATYHDLMVRFENDPILPRMLDSLTQRRLLRLSAGTYDTYNDVFKEYLVYERLPERSESSLFRLTPASALKAFRLLGGENNFTFEEFMSATGRTSATSAYNILRELRLLGLIDRAGRVWAVPDVARDYELHGRLGEYVRQTVLKNQAVSSVVVALEQSGRISRTRLAEFLRNHFLFIDVQEDVWLKYANMFALWLCELQFASADPDGTLRPVDYSSDEIHRTLGNLRIEGRGARPNHCAFIPSREVSVFEQVLDRVTTRPTRLSDLRRAHRTAAREMQVLGVVDVDDACHLIRPLKSAKEFDGIVSAMLAAPPYREFFQAVLDGCEYGEALRLAFGVESLAGNTRTTLAKKLANWGRRYGHIPEGRLKVRAVRRSNKQQVLKIFEREAEKDA